MFPAQRWIEDAPDGIVVVDAGGTVRFANRASGSLLGCDGDDLVGEYFGFPIVAGESAEIEIPRADGSWSIAEMRVSASAMEGATVYVAVLRDVTPARLAGRHFQLSEKVFENTQEGIVVTDAKGCIVSVNPAFTAVTGYLPQEAIGKNPSLLQSGRHDAEFYRAMWAELAETGQWQGEIWNRRRNGEIYPEWLNISTVRDDTGRVVHYVAVFSDISLVKKNEERLHRLAHFDALTGLPNRLLFTDRLRHALVQAQRSGALVGLLFLDLDRFKLVNDSLGHRAGDEMLQETARRLTDAVRAQDTVARLGGDEFTVILPDLGSSAVGAANVAEKIIEAIAAPFHLQGRDVFVSASVGIAVYPMSGDDADTLVKHADIAMYRAKEGGRNAYHFYRPGHEGPSRDIFELEHGLRHAIERGEMRLAYQPEIEIETGRVVAVEALLRWRHPTRGEIPPAEFIPVAEDSGLINAIGEWVLREACAQNSAWQRHGLPPIRIAVNLSARQLRNARFAEKVAEILDETGLAPEWLEVEVTESMAMQHGREAMGILWQLKSIGVHLSIDDFGTGYSALNYLKRLPVDTLKIDRSFIEGLDADANDQAISNAIIALANTLNLRVTAEGVETEKQLWFLREHNCCNAQGFFFSQPVDAEELMPLLRNTRH